MSDLWVFIVVVLAGIALGYALPVWNWLKRALSVLQFALLFVLMFLMGMTIGQDPLLKNYILTVGLQALVMTIAVIAGSVAVTLALQKVFFRRGHRFDLFYEEIENAPKQSMLKLTLIIVACMLAGYLAVVLGRETAVVAFLLTHSARFVFLFLCIMVFGSGIDIGLHKSFLSDIRKSGIAILLVPTGTMLGSILAAIVVGFVLRIAPMKAAAAASACGWYTLSGVLLSNIEPRLGALAFLLNLMREMLTPLAAPFISKRFGPFAAVSPAGCTAMDTMLGIITRCTSPAMAIIAFANGAILSCAVPGILSFFVRAI